MKAGPLHSLCVCVWGGGGAIAPFAKIYCMAIDYVQFCEVLKPIELHMPRFICYLGDFKRHLNTFQYWSGARLYIRSPQINRITRYTDLT